MQVTVKLKVECPPGYEPADGEDSFRTPKIGEQYVGTDGRVTECEVDWLSNHASRRLIVRKAYEWPSHLFTNKVAAIVQLETNGPWYACLKVPVLRDGCWSDGNIIIQINQTLFNFTPPYCDDFRDSLRVNPNWKGTQNGAEA